MATSEPTSTEFWSSGIRATLELMRPANIVTAFADILAGYAAAGGLTLYLAGGSEPVLPENLAWLLVATFGLYGGGVVLNDVFDARQDAKERPERAIPSGRVSRTFAAVLGTLLLVCGVVFAFQVDAASGAIALVVAVCVLIYDTIAKHSIFWGPLFMGFCRGGNLLLGVSILPFLLFHLWPLAFFPLIYIGAITLISQGEVEGGSRTTGFLALAFVVLITALLLLLPLWFREFMPAPALPFILLFAGMVIPPFFLAARQPEPDRIRRAVKQGVLSLIILNSALAAGFAGFLTGFVVLMLLPLSLLLARLFAVT